jgi:FkbM family methyltransferase
VGGRASVKHQMKRFAIRHHRQLSPLLPRGHRAYRYPGGRIFLDLRESPEMLRRKWGQYEPSKQRAVRRFLEPGSTFVDIGANIGDFTLLAARVMGDEGTVLAFEPSAGNVRWLEESIRVNGYRCVRVLPLALSDHDGEAELHLSGARGRHTLKPYKWLEEVGSETVPLRTLDGVLADEGVERVDVVKIDVEGGEVEVLHGAERTLSGDRPMTLLLDLHPPLVDPVAICAWLAERGFAMHEPDPPFGPLAEVHPKLTELVAIRA